MIRLAVAQVSPKKGDYAENLRRVGNVLATAAAWADPPDLIVFPESVMSGYFLEGGVRDLAVTAGTLFRDLSAQHAAAGAGPVDVVVGFYEEFQHRYYNSALYASLGGPEAKIRHVHRKVFLPTYGLFDEERFVERGGSVRAFETARGRVAMLVCEDAWHSITGSLAALDGAQLIIVLSAAPARGVVPAGGDGSAVTRPASVERWERLIRHIAEEHGVFVAQAQLVGFEGGKGMQGASTVVSPDGDILVSGPLFREALLSADLELDAITRARAAQPLLADLELQLRNLLNSSERRSDLEYDDAGRSAVEVSASPLGELPRVVAGERADPLAIDCFLAEEWLVQFIQHEVTRRRSFERVVVGLSGGVDSSLTTALAAKALGPANVIAVRMPYKTSSPDSLKDAERVAKQLGVRLETVDITGAVDGYLAAADPDASPIRRGNVMARLRMVTLFDLSAKHEALPLGSGNKTERLLGYFTWHADDSPPVNPLGDLFKSQVWHLARHMGIPDDILSKPPTADLVQGQTDEGDLGLPYERADRILYWMLKGLRQEQIVARGFRSEEVALVSHRLHGTHWKRRMPTVAMISETAIGESYLRPVDY